MNNSDNQEPVKKSTRGDLLKQLDLHTTLPPVQRRKTQLDMMLPNSLRLPGKETHNNIDRFDTSEVEAPLAEEFYQIDITCAQCNGTNLFETKTLFEKVKCPNCSSQFRVPVETEKFIYDKHIYESDFINIFRAQNKETDFYGDVVVYEKIDTSASLSNLKDILTDYALLEVNNYLSPLHYTEDDGAYYISRENASYRMNLYLSKFGALPKEQVAQVLSQICQIAEDLSDHSCYGAFLASDVMLTVDGTTKLCDYGLRESLLSRMKINKAIPPYFLAPEAVLNKVHTRVVSSAKL